MEKYIVTSALPYANGDLHIGHVAGAYLPADIFVRYLKLKKRDVIFICGTDEHGAPISIKAEAEKTTPEKIVERYHARIKQAFDGIGIEFDNFSGTARTEHHKLSQEFFTNLLNQDFISKKTSEQFYDVEKKRFLPDRYVEGTCPHCGSDGARGDQCDACGKLIDTITLKNPVSKLSGKQPVIKQTTHWYLDLPKFVNDLEKWLQTKTYWKENVHRFIMNWLQEGLIERAITRDIDWGIPVPLHDANGKVLYVWFDAPIGYISSTIEWAKRNGNPDLWEDYWLNENTKLIHFIGKDNIPFHTIIWPAILMKQDKNYVLPYDVPANEYLNIKGQKTSTSRNYAIWVNDFLESFEGEYLRYILAANAPETKDSDFSWEDFQNKINNDLANTLGNLANRVFAFSKKYFDASISEPKYLSDLSVKALKKANELVVEIENSYEHYRVRHAVKNSIDIARIGNKYFDETKPWVTIKENKQQAEETLFVCAELLRLISIVFSPIMPQKMKQLQDMLGLEQISNWDFILNKANVFKIRNVVPLIPKVSDKQIAAENIKLEEATKDPILVEHKPVIDYEHFSKMELRIAKIEKAEKIKKSKKLLKVKVDISGEKRTIVAGISKHYSLEEIIGKKVVILVNLQPRKVMGIESQGMILAAEDDGKLSILLPEKDVASGSEIS